MLSNRRLALMLLGLAGVLIVHQGAHGLTRQLGLTESSVSHDHMALLWAILGPLGAAAVAILAVRQTRLLRLEGPPSFALLAAVSGGGYLTLELMEHLSASQSFLDAMTAPSMLLGLVLAPLIAALLRRAVDGATAIMAALTSAPARRYAGQPIPLRVSPPEPIRVPAPGQFSHHRRGPPDSSRLHR